MRPGFPAMSTCTVGVTRITCTWSGENARVSARTHAQQPAPYVKTLEEIRRSENYSPPAVWTIPDLPVSRRPATDRQLIRRLASDFVPAKCRWRSLRASLQSVSVRSQEILKNSQNGVLCKASSSVERTLTQFHASFTLQHTFIFYPELLILRAT